MALQLLDDLTETATVDLYDCQLFQKEKRQNAETLRPKAKLESKT